MELVLESMKIVKTDASNSSKALDEMYSLTAALDPRLRASWFKNLPTAFEVEGFELVEAHRCHASQHHEYAMHESNLLIYDMVTRFSPSDEARKISSLVPEAAIETRKGATISFERLVVIGRKFQD